VTVGGTKRKQVGKENPMTAVDEAERGGEGSPFVLLRLRYRNKGEEGEEKTEMDIKTVCCVEK
jgi:hypothetical protein